MAAFAARVLSEMGWEQHYALPVLNTENKALIDEVSMALIAKFYIQRA